MTVYYALYALIGLFSVSLYAKDVRRGAARKIVCAVSFVVLFLMFALRHPSMGVDLGYGKSTGYLAWFRRIARFTWADTLTSKVVNYERGYVIFNKLISLVSDDYQWFLAMCAMAALLLTIWTIYKKCYYPDLAIYIFMGLPTFLMLFSGIRQSIAIAICFWAIQYIEEKKLYKFIATVLFAMTFHKTAWVFLFAYPIYYFPMRRSWRTFTYLVIPLVYIFRYPIFIVLRILFKENAVPDNNNAITLFIVFTLVYIFCCIFSGEDEQTKGLKNLFFVSCCIQAIGGVYSTVMRVGYYFMNSLILLLPLVIYRQKNRDNARIIRVVVGICFVVFGLHQIRNGTWSQSYPYKWFW